MFLSTRNSPLVICPILESQHLHRGLPLHGGGGSFALSFPPLFMLIHPVACVLLDKPIFFPHSCRER